MAKKTLAQNSKSPDNTFESNNHHQPLSVVYRPVESLKPFVHNPWIHPKKQIAQIATSIGQFDFVNPVLINNSGDVIAGHGRLLAAKSIGMTDVPTITLPHLDEAQQRALRIADNKIAQNASWDLDLLQHELQAIAVLDVDFDLTVTGFSTGELDVTLPGQADPADEDIPAVPKTPRTQPGDIFQCGEHVVGCGDCRDSEFMREVIGDGMQVDVAFLDPPFNVKIKGHANTKGRHREFMMASGEMSDEDFQGFLGDSLGCCAAVSRNGAVHFVCMDWRHMHDVTTVGDSIYGKLINLAVWNKSNAGMGSLYRSKHELVFVFRVGDAQHLNNVELGRHRRNRTNVWDYASVNTLGGSRRQDLDLHPTVKPVALVMDAIQDVTKRGDLVLDAFLGSGTTLIAAERCGRRFCGMDIDPAYVDVAIERWEAMTGQKAQLRTGQ